MLYVWFITSPFCISSFCFALVGLTQSLWYTLQLSQAPVRLPLSRPISTVLSLVLPICPITIGLRWRKQLETTHATVTTNYSSCWTV
ncbi:hypothetical protein IWX50DRAFT_269182 [Phyllosticta citricarpa]